MLETPKPYTGFDQDSAEPANGFNYNYLKISQFPKNDIGYRTLDLQLTKDFELPGSPVVQLRMDVLNVFNTRNYATLFDGYPGKPYYFKDGDVAGVMRTLKVSVNVKL